MSDNGGDGITSAAGIPIKDVYTPDDVKGMDYGKDLGMPGGPPYTRGVYRSMYRGRLWTIRRLTGYSSPEETNQRYREEYAVGQTGFSMADDISTCVGMDPDDPRVIADVGHCGVPVFSVEDMEKVFEGLPIEKCSTYLADRVGGLWTPAYFLMAERRGIPLTQVRGTTANTLLSWASMDLGYQIPPHGVLRYAVDLIEWCAQHAPKWYPVSLNSYNPRDNAITAVQELGMLMAEGIQYIEEAKRRGRVPLNDFVRRFTFDMGAHNDFFEEIAKFRAARRMWYRIVRERYGIDDPTCGQFRVHVQSSGSTHTYQEPLNNLVRIAYQVMAAVLGGAQSIHANGYDEAVCLPTEQAMLLAIRTEQIVALETGVTNTIDPLGGSYYVESLTNEMEERAWEYVKKIEDMGGLAQAIASGFIHQEFKKGIVEHEKKLASGEITIVGVNKFRLDKVPYEVPIFQPDPHSTQMLVERIQRLRRERDNARVEQALKRLEEAVRSDENTFGPTLEAVKAQATPGELARVQLDVYGQWDYPIGG